MTLSKQLRRERIARATKQTLEDIAFVALVGLTLIVVVITL